MTQDLSNTISSSGLFQEYDNDVIIHEPKLNDNEVLRLLDKYSYNNSTNDKEYTYGTAGFRYLATELTPIMVRVGIVASLQAFSNTATNTVGIMITASHNDESYNGIKLAQSPDGGMMNESGEIMATYIVNERDHRTKLSTIINQYRTTTSLTSSSSTPVVHIGRDTREHSVSFACLVCKVITAMGCTVYDHGIITTPMLHHCVKHYTPQYLPSLIPSRSGITGYYDLLINSYTNLLQTKIGSGQPKEPVKTLYVDCACGVGYTPIQYIANHKLLQQQQLNNNNNSSTTRIVPFNAPGTGPLNDGCGSEYVQKELRLPHIYDDNNNNDNNDIGTFHYCASFDGDADRIVFFYKNNNNTGNLRLLDGDKIATIICQFIKEQLNTIQSALTTTTSDSSPNIIDIRMGVVQTAYANGASTSYLRRVLGNDNVLIAKTGVKYVHTMAHDNFDIGIYFESNGHGTIIFGTKFYQYIYHLEHILLLDHPNQQQASVSKDVLMAYQRLRILPALVNQAVGDAISDLLLIDGILQIMDISIQQWDEFYTDYPSRQAKVKVIDRSIIKTNDNETQCIEPAIVQKEIDIVVTNEFGGPSVARGFIRPSGTENVVRVYAEASTSRHDADTLANRLIDIVYNNCHGISDKPYIPTSSATSKM